MGILADILEGVPVSTGAPSAFGELEVLADVYEVAGGEFSEMQEALNRILALDLPGVHIRFFGAEVGHVPRCVYSTGDSRRLYQTPMFKRWRNGFSDKWTEDGGQAAADAVFSGGAGWAGAGVAGGWSSAGWAA